MDRNDTTLASSRVYTASVRRRENATLTALVLLGLSALACLALTLLHRGSWWLSLALVACFAGLFAYTERLLSAWRPFALHGRLARWRHPARGPVARAIDAMANSRVVGALLEPLPVVEMVSDVTDVVYVNYLVRAEQLEALVPPGLELQRLGPEGAYALFTFLTYHHGHFGFALLGPLRRLFPSPVQSNWRVHVRNPATGHEGIYFVTNAIDYTAPALGARLLTEGMPMHVLRDARVTTRDDGALAITLDPGAGTAPDCEGVFHPSEAPVWEGAWKLCWPDFQAFLAYCLPQDRAMSSQPLRRRVSRQEIHLGIDPARCVPLRGEMRSKAAEAIAGEAVPLCFRVPGLKFRFSVEAYDPMK